MLAIFYYLHHSHVNENVKAGCRGHLGNIYAENSFLAKPWKMDRISIGRENKGKTFPGIGNKGGIFKYG